MREFLNFLMQFYKDWRKYGMEQSDSLMPLFSILNKDVLFTLVSVSVKTNGKKKPHVKISMDSWHGRVACFFQTFRQ